MTTITPDVTRQVLEILASDAPAQVVQWAGVPLPVVRRAAEALQQRVERHEAKRPRLAAAPPLPAPGYFDEASGEIKADERADSPVLLRMLPCQVETTRHLARALRTQVVSLLSAETGLGKSYIAIGAAIVSGLAQRVVVYTTPATMVVWQELQEVLPRVPILLLTTRALRDGFDHLGKVSFGTPLRPNLPRLRLLFERAVVVIDEWDDLVDTADARLLGSVAAHLAARPEWQSRMVFLSALRARDLVNHRHPRPQPMTHENFLVLCGFECQVPGRRGPVDPVIERLASRTTRPILAHAAQHLARLTLGPPPPGQAERVLEEARKLVPAMHWPRLVADYHEISWEARKASVLTHRCDLRVAILDEEMFDVGKPLPETNRNLAMVNHITQHLHGSDPARTRHLLETALAWLLGGTGGLLHVVVMCHTMAGLVEALRYLGRYELHGCAKEAPEPGLRVFLSLPQESLASRSKVQRAFRNHPGQALLLGLVGSLHRGVTLCSDRAKTVGLVPPLRNSSLAQQAAGRFQRLGFTVDTECYLCYESHAELDLFHLVGDCRGMVDRAKHEPAPGMVKALPRITWARAAQRLDTPDTTTTADRIRRITRNWADL